MRMLTAAADYRKMPWKNGRGSTLELCRFDKPDGHMGWRVSIAGVTEDGPFSLFPGYERHIMVIAGEGMILAGGPQASIPVFPALVPARFQGEWPVSARLTAGPVKDFNLIVDRKSYRSELYAHALTAPSSFAAGDGTLLLYMHTGKATANQLAIGETETLVLEPGDSACLTPAARDCTIIVAQIEPLPGQ
jgi:uncharacterized protein